MVSRYCTATWTLDQPSAAFRCNQETPSHELTRRGLRPQPKDLELRNTYCGQRPHLACLRGFTELSTKANPYTIELSLDNEPLRGLFLLFICHRWIQMHTDAVAGMFVTYTYRDCIGLVQALACHPLPRMCSLSQDLLFKWRTDLMNEETPIERRPLLRSPAQYSIWTKFPFIS